MNLPVSYLGIHSMGAMQNCHTLAQSGLFCRLHPRHGLEQPSPATPGWTTRPSQANSFYTDSDGQSDAQNGLRQDMLPAGDHVCQADYLHLLETKATDNSHLASPSTPAISSCPDVVDLTQT